MLDKGIFIFLFVGCCLSEVAPGEKSEIDIDDLDGFDFYTEYQDLNHALEQRTTEVTPESNFEAALQIYQDNLERNIKPCSKIMIAIKLFLALRTIDQDNRCNFKTANLIEQNSRASDRKALQPGGRDLGHVAGVIRIIGERHARECQQVYELKFDSISRIMDKLKVTLVEELLHNLIEQHISDKYRSNMSKSLARRYHNVVKWQINPTRKLFNPDFLYDTLKRVAKNDIDSKYLIPVYDEQRDKVAFVSEKIQLLFEKYFIEPCKYYHQELGHEVFDQKDHDGPFGEVDESNPEFYKAWAQYHLCSAFQERSDSIYSKFITNLHQKEENIIKSM